jgi:hypothetical protein
MRLFNASIVASYTTVEDITTELRSVGFTLTRHPEGSVVWAKRFTLTGTNSLNSLDISGTGISNVTTLIIRNVSNGAGSGFRLPRQADVTAGVWEGSPASSNMNNTLLVNGVWAFINGVFPPLPQSGVSIQLFSTDAGAEVDIILVGDP